MTSKANNKKSLKSVVYKEFLRKAIIPILFIEVALIAFYFITVNYMTDKSVEIMSQTAKQSLTNLSDVEARYIDNKFRDIRYKTIDWNREFEASQEPYYKHFASDVIPKDLPWGSGVLITDDKANVLISSHVALDILGEKIVKPRYVDSIPYATQQPVNLGNSSVGKEIHRLVSGLERSKEFTYDGEPYFMTQASIDMADWKLVIITNLESVYAPIYEQKVESQNLGYLVVVLIINFYIAFFIYLLVTSNRFARRITQPIKNISQYISHMNQHNTEDAPVSYVDIKELDELIDLNVEIQEVKQNYRKINEEISHKNKQLERLAVTDPLTQAYNRLKLDEVLTYEIARSRRDKNPLSVVLLDVDNFKGVNDTYGHQVGDSVLIDMTQLLKKSIRRTDILGRWGGEEFLLILPNTDMKSAAIQAEKLRRLIEITKFDEVGSVTASFGVSSCLESCSERLLVDSADQALYAAKKAGRNQVQYKDKDHPVKLHVIDSKKTKKDYTG